MPEQTPEPAPLELPDNPNLEWLRKQAKTRLAELRQVNPRAKLAEAQFELAKRCRREVSGREAAQERLHAEHLEETGIDVCASYRIVASDRLQAADVERREHDVAGAGSPLGDPRGRHRLQRAEAVPAAASIQARPRRDETTLGTEAV